MCSAPSHWCIPHVDHISHSQGHTHQYLQDTGIHPCLSFIPKTSELEHKSLCFQFRGSQLRFDTYTISKMTMIYYQVLWQLFNVQTWCMCYNCLTVSTYKYTLWVLLSQRARDLRSRPSLTLASLGMRSKLSVSLCLSMSLCVSLCSLLTLDPKSQPHDQDWII